jgi:hypothetical protein
MVDLFVASECKRLRVNVKEMIVLYSLLNSSYKYRQAQGAR